MPKLTLFTQAARDGSNIAASAENMVNCYVEQAPGDARTRLTARSVLGEQAFADISNGLVRAIQTVNGVIYVVANGELYSVTSGGTVTSLGNVTDSADTSISGNGSTYVTVAAGGNYYVWDGSTLTQPTGGRFTGGAAVAVNDFDTLIVQPNGREWEWTSTADPTSRSALNFATKEGRNDNLLRIVPFGREIYLFGEESTEVWRNTGATGATRYQRLVGGVIDEGLLAYNLVVRFENGIFLVGDDGVCKITSGTGFIPVSTPSVQTDIDESTPLRVDYYEDRGHKFCCVIFSDRPAWVFDFTTKLWHRRASGVSLDQWLCRGITKLGTAFYMVSDLGKVQKMVRNNTDVLSALKRRVVSKPLYFDGRKFSVSKLQWLGRVGGSELGRDAVVNLRISRNGGHTWSNELDASIGDLGDYDVQAEFFALGRGENFTAEFSITDAADIQMYSDANVEIR